MWCSKQTAVKEQDISDESEQSFDSSGESSDEDAGDKTYWPKDDEEDEDMNKVQNNAEENRNNSDKCEEDKNKASTRTQEDMHNFSSTDEDDYWRKNYR